MRPVQRHGTAKDDANSAPGYVASGESEYSRNAARSNDIKLGHGKRTDGRLIRETEKALQKLKDRIAVENDKERLLKLSKDFAIKTAFLKRLREPNGRQRIEEKIETIPGADEFEPWDKIV